jgi:protein SCO1/2
MGSRRTAALRGLAILLLSVAACSRTPKPETKEYFMRGQVLAVLPDRQQLTVRHEDIAGLMPGMTMTFLVAKPELLSGRVPGELIDATLSVTDSLGTLVAITSTGTAPLSDGAAQSALLADLLEPGSELPDAALIDQDDRRRSLSEWRGSMTLVTFIYTSCPLPNFCPLMDQNFSTVQRAVAEEPVLAGKVKLVSISFDPDHDTPAVLRAHAAKRRADAAVWTFLTGDRVTLERVAGRFGVSVMREGQSVEITHNLRTALIGADGRVIKIYSGSQWTPGEVLSDLRAAVRRP